MIINELLLKLPSLRNEHAPTTEMHKSLTNELRSNIETMFEELSLERREILRSGIGQQVPCRKSSDSPHSKDDASLGTPALDSALKGRDCVEQTVQNQLSAQFDFGPFGKIDFPYFRMGNKDSRDLFDLDELIIFSFYWVNRNRYKRVLDIGANIGLHSLILAKCGFEVTAYEPDPIHFQQLENVLVRNQIKHVVAHSAAVSNQRGHAKFIRVLNNTTGSHLAGCKNPYGELEEIVVPLADIRNLIGNIDLIKMDVEGHEKEILLATNGKDWESMDAMVEIGTAENGRAIYDHFQKEGVHLFAQKINWQRVTRFEEVPVSFKEGSLFISKKSTMLWE